MNLNQVKLVLLFCFGILLLFNFSCSNKKPFAVSNEPKQFAFAESSGNSKRKISPNASLFERNLPEEINLSDENNEVSKRILKDYGAIFVAQNNVAAPPKIISKTKKTVLRGSQKFRRSAKTSAASKSNCKRRR